MTKYTDNGSIILAFYLSAQKVKTYILLIVF
jgi:hypothetical protein